MKISKSGYKKNSKDKNEPALVIPSNEITMENVQFPVLGISDTGDVRIMNPGEEHVFNGNYVYELPIAQDGGYILPGRYRNPEGNWVSKYAGGGDISIPDLSNKGWLSKYQTGGVHQKIYTDPLEFEEANQTYQDSLSLYKLGETELKRFYNGDPGESYGKIKSLKDLNEATKTYTGSKLNNQLYNAGRDTLNSNGNVQKISKIYNKTGILPTEFWANQGSMNYRFKKPTEKPKLDQQAVMQQISKDYPGYSIKFEKDKIFIREPETEYMIDNGIYNIWQPVLQKKPSTLEDIYRITKRFENMELPNGFQSDYDSGKSNLGFTKEEQDIIYGLPEHILKKVIVPHNNGEYFTFPQPNYQELKSIDLSSREPQLHTSSNNITNTKFKTKPIMRSAQDTKTGQYQIGYNYWDDKSKSWKQKMFSKETQQENYDDVKIPRKKTIKVPPQFQNGGWLSKYQDAGSVSSKYDLMRVDQPTAVASSTNVVVPNIVNVPKKVAAIKPEVPKYNKIPTKSKKESYPPKNYSKISSRPGVSGSMVTVFVDPKTGEEWISPEQQAAQQEYNELSRSNNIDRIGTTILAGSVAAPLLRPALSYLNAPAVLPYFGEVPWLTANNVIGAAGATDAIVNRFPEIPGQLLRGEYMDAAINAGTGTLDLFGANMVSPFKGGKYTFSTPKQLPGSSNADPELEAIRKILRKNVTFPKHTGPASEPGPWLNRFLEQGDNAWSIGNMETGRTSDDISDILLNLPIKTPKRLPGVNGTFKSEIDWRNWVKYKEDFDNNPDVINELFNIERSTKADGTWMKNPDGSFFEGTPEQFVVQQSKNFKRAFGESQLLNPNGSPMFLYHGSAKKFDTFDPSKFQLGDAGYSGSGIYTTPSKTKADSYSLSSAKLHTGDIEPTVYQLYGQGNRPIKSSDLIKQNKDYDLFNFHRARNWKGDVPLEQQMLDYDAAVSDQLPGIEYIRPLHDAREIVFPRNTQIKSAVGNILFDMSNPNIYKGLVPAAIAGAGALQKEKHGGWVDKYQDGGDYNMQRALELGYTPDETGHWDSVDSETGMWLKSKKHPTSWMEYLYGYTLNPELNKTTNVVINPEGYFGENQLQYVRKYKKGGVKSSGEGYYDYINGYSGIFAKGGNVSKKNNWLNKYK